MAVNKDRRSTPGMHPRKQPPEGPVIGFVQSLNSSQGFIDGNPLRINLLGIADHPRDRPEPSGYPH